MPPDGACDAVAPESVDRDEEDIRDDALLDEARFTRSADIPFLDEDGDDDFDDLRSAFAPLRGGRW